MSFLLALEIVSQAGPCTAVSRWGAWAVLTHSAAGHLPHRLFLLCTAPALPDLPAQQWEDFPSALTQSHTNPNVFTESRG